MAEAAVEHGADEVARDAPIRAFLVGVLILGAAVVVARAFLAAVVRQAPPTLEDYGSGGAKRIGQFVAALPAIAAERSPTGIVFGTSLAFFALSTERFDDELANKGVRMTTFTSATPVMAPSVTRALAARVERAYAERHRPLDLALVEFAPHNMTVATAHALDTFHRIELHDLAEVLDARRTLDLAVAAPDEAGHVVAQAALGNAEPSVVNGVLGRWLLMPAEEREARRQSNAPQLMLQRGLEKVYGSYPAWNPKSRGEPRWLHVETAFAYTRMVKAFAASRPRHRARLVELNDAVELHMDPDRLAEFVALVKELQGFSTHTMVWLAPRNTDWLMPSDAGLARLAAALDEVRAATGAPIIDLTTMPDVHPEDFFDATHLSEHGGRPKLSKRLADEVAERLGSAPAADPGR